MWNETSLTWLVDGAPYAVRTAGQPPSLFLPPAPMYLILNTAIAPWVKGGVDFTDTVFHYIDAVRVFACDSAGGCM